MKILTLYLGQYTPVHGTGNHQFHYIAYYEGQEAAGPRGWGQTAREAELDLQKQPTET